MRGDSNTTRETGKRSTMKHARTWISTALRLGLLVPAAFCLLRLAAAELEFRHDTPSSVAKAASVGNTEYRERLGDMQPSSARSILQKATEADPLASSAWISLGLAEERVSMQNRAGNFATARQALETAFRVDHQYAPAWALANFCFRHDDPECFWRAERRAALRAPQLADPDSINLGDLRPLLELARNMEPAPIALLAQLTAPRSDTALTSDRANTAEQAETFRGQIERAYLNDLIVGKRWEDATIVALRLISHRHGNRAQDLARLDDFVDRLLDAHRPAEAVQVWNAYADFPALDPSRGVVLTNGDFASMPRQTGFDWRFAPQNASEIHTAWKPSLVEFRFQGQRFPMNAPEQTLLLEQRLPLRTGKYRLRFEYSTRDLSMPTGIRWELQNGKAAGDLAGSLESSDQWREASCAFSVAAAGIAPLRLVYRRAPGTDRARGTLFLRHMRWEVL